MYTGHAIKSNRRKDAVKNTKRILEVKIIRAIDTDPDTSYYGEYSTRPDSEFSIDRATDEFQGDIDNGRDWLNRVSSFLEDRLSDGERGEDSCYDEPEQDWKDAAKTIEEILNDAPFDDDSVSWNSREYRYFNPSDNYKGEPAEDIRKYVRQDYKRMEAYNRQEWYYVGVRATAEVELSAQINKGCVSGHEVYNKSIQTIRSGGLWGIESDSDRAYLEQIEKEELSDLRDSLKMLGFSTRAISAAFKNVVRKDVDSQRFSQ
jgi:hypothetical protein